MFTILRLLWTNASIGQWLLLIVLIFGLIFIVDFLRPGLSHYRVSASGFSFVENQEIADDIIV
jgi:hypothetical protein